MFSRVANRLAIPVAGRNPKWTTADEAVADIKSDMDIYVHAHASTPTELLNSLCKHVDAKNLAGIRLSHILLGGNVPWTEKKYWGKMRSNCLFICGNLRKLVKQGEADYTPVFLSDIPRLFHDKIIPVDVSLITVSPPDSRGYCTLGVNIEGSKSAIQNAKKIIAIVNPSMPRTFGDTLIHSSQIDTMVEIKDREIYGKQDGAEPSEVEMKIGKLIAENLVEDEATLQLEFECCSWTNNVDVIRANSKMTSINSALEIDLTGQIVSDSIGSTFYSGFGGQVDFVYGASNSHDGKGKAIIALPSRTTKGKSKIVPVLQQGAGVVTTRAHVRYVVTEFGIAQLYGKSVRQRAHALINIAHPDDREELERNAFTRLRCIPTPF
uniref:Acetyl-CoA hydrolase n=1 Tax=Heterorhabditis bacteriophora TaxID=37862 RepID=A0A1I7XUJ3_HETBA